MPVDIDECAQLLAQVAQGGAIVAASGLTEHMAVEAFEKGRRILAKIVPLGREPAGMSVTEIRSLLAAALEVKDVRKRELRDFQESVSNQTISIQNKSKTVKGRAIVGSVIQGDVKH